jgi:DNA polymerase-4
MARIIMHLDMDAYFASVEQQASPALRGRPIGVTGKPQERSIVVAASREAKRFGVSTGMPIWEARRCCPQLQLVSGSASRYIATTKRFLSILKRYTGMIEVFSIDEVFMDITQEAPRYGGPVAMANAIKQEFREQLGAYITGTFGIAGSRTFAKLTAKQHKPDGIGVLDDEEIPELLRVTPTEAVCGIGRRIAARLAKVGIHTLADLGAAPEAYLHREFGIYGLFLKQVGLGRDPTPITPYTSAAPVKSVGHSKTLPPVLRTLDAACLVLRGLCDKVGRRMRQLGFVGRTVHFGVRLGALGPHWGKQITLPLPTDDGEAIYRACLAIRGKMPIEPETVFNIGVSVSNLVDREGMPGYLLEEDRRRDRLNHTVDRIRDRFGEKAIVTGEALLFDPLPEHVSGFAQGEQWEF